MRKKPFAIIWTVFIYLVSALACFLIITFIKSNITKLNGDIYMSENELAIVATSTIFAVTVLAIIISATITKIKDEIKEYFSKKNKK